MGVFINCEISCTILKNNTINLLLVDDGFVYLFNHFIAMANIFFHVRHDIIFCAHIYVSIHTIDLEPFVKVCRLKISEIGVS